MLGILLISTLLHSMEKMEIVTILNQKRKAHETDCIENNSSDPKRLHTIKKQNSREQNTINGRETGEWDVLPVGNNQILDEYLYTRLLVSNSQ